MPQDEAGPGEGLITRPAARAGHREASRAAGGRSLGIGPVRSPTVGREGSKVDSLDGRTKPVIGTDLAILWGIVAHNLMIRTAFETPPTVPGKGQFSRS